MMLIRSPQPKIEKKEAADVATLEKVAWLTLTPPELEVAKACCFAA